MSNHNDDLEFNDDLYDDDSLAVDDYQDAPDPIDDPLGGDFVEPFDGDDLGADLDGLNDDEWEDSDFIDSDNNGLGTEKKKSKFDLNFNTMMIGGAVILGVAVLLFQLTLNKPASVQEKFSSAINMQGATQGPILSDQTPEQQSQVTDVRLDNKSSKIENTVTPQNQNAQNSIDQGFLFEPEILDVSEVSVVNISDNPVSEVLDDMPVLPVDVIDKNVPRVPPEIITMAEEVLVTEGVPQVQDNEITEEALVEVPKQAIKADVTPVFESVKSSDVNITEMSEKLDLIFGRLDQMEAQITALDQSDRVDVKDISAEVESLKATIKSLGKAPQQKAKSKAITKPVANKVVRKKTSTPKKAAVTWELRAAQPGKAWVSKKGSRDIEPITVGQSLSGVGRIKSISYVSGKWLIQGTSGSIRQ